MPRTKRRSHGPRLRRAARAPALAPDIESVPASLVRESFSEYVSRVAFTGRRVVVKHHGRPRAAIVPMEDLELLRALEDRLDLRAALKALRVRGSKSWLKVKSELGL